MRRSPSIASAAVPFFLFAAAALLFSINLDRLPHPDELYQIQAAEGLLATGEPRIADGLYTRAYAQTWLIAQSLSLAGDTLAAARLSSMLSMAAVTALLFVWLRPGAGALAAWIAAVGFALSPFTVQTAQFARIYGVQSLSFFLVCLFTYLALSRKADDGPGSHGRWLLAPWRLALFALAAVNLALALHLQPTTLFGVLGLVLWAAGAVALPWLRDPIVPSRHKLVAVGACLLAALAVLAITWQAGILPRLWHVYRSVPLFNEVNKDEFWYYHGWYSLMYPSLWTLTGFLALVALVAAPRPASLALCVFGAGFLLNSFAAQKSMRYIAYAQPFLLVLWGVGLAALWSPLRRFLASLLDQLATVLPLPQRWARPVAAGLAAMAFLFLLVANPASIRTATLLADVPVPGEQPNPDWPAAKPILAPLTAQVPILVTTEELGALYYLGRFDVRFSPSKMREFDGEHEFAADPRTGRAVISTPEALRLVFQCFDEGLFVIPARQWDREHILSESVRELILGSTRPVPLPQRTRILAYTWQRPEGATRPAECASVPAMPGPAARVPGH
jgi:hypothetical protein